MSTTLDRTTTVLSTSAYALVGAADKLLAQTRQLTARREELPDELAAQLEESMAQLRSTLERVVDQLGERVTTTTDEAGEAIESLADRGRAIIDRFRDADAVNAAEDDLEQARQGWAGAVTAVRNNARAAASRLKAARTLTTEAAGSVVDAATSVTDDLTRARDEVDLNAHTKEELYELATQRDIEGRSSMSKAQLVSALSADA